MFYLSPSLRIVNGYKYCTIYDSDEKKVYEVNKDLGNLILKTKKFDSFDQFKIIVQNNLAHIYSDSSNVNSVISKIRTRKIYIPETLLELKPKFKFDSAPPKKPYRSRIEITSKCNLKCKYCYASTNSQHNEIAKQKVIKLIEELSALGIKHIEFTGGEPLLNGYLKDYIEHALSHSMKIRIATNGTLFNDNIVDYFISSNIQIQVSLHEVLQHVIQKRYNYKNILNLTVGKYLQKIAKLKPELLSITHTVTKDSIKFVDDFLSYVKGLNVRTILGRPFRVGRAIENWDSIKISAVDASSRCFVEDEGRKNISFRCGPCNLDNLNILYNGNVSTCVLLRKGKAILGNIYESALSDIWYNAERKNLSSLRVDDIPICSKCEYKYICGGGCMAGSYSLVGKVGEPFPYCVFQKEKVKKYYNEKYKTTDI